MSRLQSLAARVRSSIVLWVVVLGTIFSGWAPGIWFLIAVCGLLAQREFYAAQKGKGIEVYQTAGLFCGLLFYLNSFYFLVAFPQSDLLWMGESVLIAAALIVPLIQLIVTGEPRTNPIVATSLTSIGALYIAYLFNFASHVSFWPGHFESTRYVLLYLIVVTKFSDIGAYVTGSLIGRNKMIPRISPGKTWEGFMGGMVFSWVASLSMALCLPERLGGIHWGDAVLLGVLLPLAATLGDLAESAVKRDANLKDSGKSIPGIGGAFDLIDSLLFTAPILYFYLQLVTHPAL